MIFELAVLALLGAATGLIGAVLGVGGGVFLIPALVLYFKFPMIQAAGAGLVTVIATSNSAASVNVERGTVNMRLGMVLELATVIGALAASLIAGSVAPGFLIGLFGVLLAVLSALLWKQPPSSREDRAARDLPDGPLDGEYYDPAEKRVISYRLRGLPIGLAVSLAAGCLSGLLGIGGGVFKVPVLHLFCGIPMKAAAATSNFMIGVTAAASAFIYLGRGHIVLIPSAAIVLGVLAGAAAGTVLSSRLKDQNVRKAFAILLAALSLQMLRRAFHG